VPSRARTRLRIGSALLVGEQLAIDGIGDPALETPHCLEGLLALGPLTSVGSPTLGIETDLGDRGNVDHVVDPPVPRSGEPVPVLLTRRGVQGCGAGPGREPVAVGEPGHVTDIGQDPGRHHRPDTAKILNREPRANTITLSSAVAFLILASTATSSASSSAAMLRPVLPAMSRGRTRASIALACSGVMSFSPDQAAVPREGPGAG